MRLTLRELRGQLAILALVLWGLAGLNMATPTWRLRSGQVKGTDFVHFYTLARLGAEGHADRFADEDVQRSVQLASLPESSGAWFPPAYGPQIAMLLAPLGYLTYGHALLLWTGLTTATYLLALGTVIRRGTIVQQHFGLAMLGAASFPPFWSLIQHGQLSILALGSFLAAWLSLRRRSHLLAGAALGLLVYKPPLAVPTFCVLVLAGEWRMWLAFLLSASWQAAAIVWWVGLAGLRTYGDLLLSSPRLANLLTARPSQMHSWRAFWSMLVPDSYSSAALYAFSAVATIILAALLWRRLQDPNLRISVITLAAVLASPHLYSYDLVILAPSWIWLTDWYLTRTDLPALVGRTLYLGYVSPMLSVFALAFHVQLSTLCFAALLVWLWRFHPTTQLAGPLPIAAKSAGLP